MSFASLWINSLTLRKMRWNLFSCRALKSILPTPYWLWCKFEEEEIYLFLFCWGESLWTGASVQQLRGKQWRCSRCVKVATQPTGADRSLCRKRSKFHWLCRTEFQMHLSALVRGEYAECPFFWTEADGSWIKLQRVDGARRGAWQQNRICSTTKWEISYK